MKNIYSMFLLDSFSGSVIKVSVKFGGVGTDSRAFNMFLVDLNKFFRPVLNAPSNSKYSKLNLN